MTEQVAAEAAAEEEERLLCEQELSNLLQRKDYVRAVGVALTLDQPFRVLTILQGTEWKGLLDITSLHCSLRFVTNKKRLCRSYPFCGMSRKHINKSSVPFPEIGCLECT